MTEQGRVIEILEARRGLNPRTNNTWVSQEFVIETNDRFPLQICFNIFGEEKVNMARLRIGEQLTISGYAASHKFGDRWFTEIRCTDIIDNGLSRFVKPIFPDEQR